MRAYYNEFDPYAARWIENLATAGHVAPGRVDARSILELEPHDVADATQVHLFAGIGVWSHALRLAGWPDDRPIWTGSCPCQPFSSAGKRDGLRDSRHVWPEMFRLIRECRPGVVVGEQVASADALAWWDAVSADLEGEGYAVAAVDLCAAGVGAPHRRQRLFWVAYAPQVGHERAWRTRQRRARLADDGEALRLADAGGERRDWLELRLLERGPLETGAQAAGDGEAGGLADAERERVRARGPGSPGSPPSSLQGDHGERQRIRAHALASDDAVGAWPGPLDGYWRDADWLLCRDGAWRPVEPGTFPLADGAPARVGRLRAYGNAICAPLAAEFLRAVMDVIDAPTPAPLTRPRGNGPTNP